MNITHITRGQFAFLLGFAFIIASGTAAAVFFLGRDKGLLVSEGPVEAYERILKLSEAGHHEKAYDLIDKRSQGKLDVALKLALGFAPVDAKERERIGKLNGRELYAAVMRIDPKRRIGRSEVKSVTVNGDRATLETISTIDGKPHPETIHMVREDGVWKLSIGE
jgi:hypothetical protein